MLWEVCVWGSPLGSETFPSYVGATSRKLGGGGVPCSGVWLGSLVGSLGVCASKEQRQLGVLIGLGFVSSVASRRWAQCCGVYNADRLSLAENVLIWFMFKTAGNVKF